MPSIADLFGPSGDDPNFNLDDFLSEADAAAAASPERQYAMGGMPTEPTETEPVPPAPAPVSQAGDEDGGTGTGDDGGVTAPPAAEPPAPYVAPDPFMAIPAERRASLLALDQIMLSTPGAVDRVFDVLKPTPEVPRPAPTLPEGIDPEDPVAAIWHQNQTILDRFDRMDREQQEAVRAEAQAQRQNMAATAAVTNFRSRYPDLSPSDVAALSQSLGASGIPQALVARPGVDPQASYEEALEIGLWRDPDLRARVTGAPSVSAPPAPPVTGPTPEREANKRTLHALSSGAAPVSGPPPEQRRGESETRLDGTLTPRSKSLLVDELASQLRSSGYK